MAGLREIAREYKDEIMDGIAWVAIWKTGKGWNARSFWLDMDSEMIGDADMQEARDIVSADADAIFINEYFCAHMGEGSLKDIAAGIRFFYENGYNVLRDSTAYRKEERTAERKGGTDAAGKMTGDGKAVIKKQGGMDRFDPDKHIPVTSDDESRIIKSLWEGWELMVEDSGYVWIGDREEKIAQVTLGPGGLPDHM